MKKVLKKLLSLGLARWNWAKSIVRWLKNLVFFYVKPYKNKSFYKVFGMRRSGNHAIINWMICQMDGLTIHLNNMIHPPEKTHTKNVFYNGFSKVNLLGSLEDRVLNDLILDYKSQFFGSSKIKYQILILRDPYNWLASWYAWKDELGHKFRTDRKYRNEIIKLWKDYAYLYLEWIKKNDTVNIAVNFNVWHQDIEYRKSLAQKLDLKFSDKGINKVSKNGFGSSFDQLEYKGKGTKMDVLNRWKKFENDKFFMSFFDEELIQLNRDIFEKTSFYNTKH